jgi:cytochrome c553
LTILRRDWYKSAPALGTHQPKAFSTQAIFSTWREHSGALIPMFIRFLASLFALLVGSAHAQDASVAPPPIDTTQSAPSTDISQKPGDAAAGQTKANVCAACHGLDGNSTDPQYPKIAGQHAAFIVRQLKLFKSAERDGPVMLGFASTLSEQDMNDLAAYFSSQTIVAGTADEATIPESSETWVKRGERLYRGGNQSTNVPACMSCHGPSGRGNPGPAYPAIGGQHAQYTRAKLQAFRQGVVWGKAEQGNAIMAEISKNLSDTDINALATYIEGLHRSE